jgi:hypothetical protein
VIGSGSANAALQKQRHDVDIMMRPAKGVLGVEKRSIAAAAADDDVGIQENVRRKRGVSWTEIADRPPKTSLSTDERVAFLRLVKSIRANTVAMQVRDAGGRWGPPSCCISLAAELMQIAPRTAYRIHSEFQQQKAVPDVKGPLQRERPWLMEAVFGKATIRQWVTEHLLACVAKKQRATYQSIRDYLRQVAPIHIQDTSSLLLMDEDLAESIEAACKVLHYQNVRRWCSKQGMRVTKLGKIKRTYSGENSKIQAWYAAFCRTYIAYADDPNVVFIFCDESYVNQFHARNYAVVDTRNPQTRLEGAKKGMRYCMATGITLFGEIEVIDPLQGQGFNPAKSGRWYFCPNKSQEKRQGKDYHKSFNEESYVPYFKERLVPACERAFPNKKCVFVFDNATYHITTSYKVGETPVDRSKNKDVLAAFLVANGRPAPPRNRSGKVSESRAELLVQFDELVAQLGSELDIFCRDRGHAILLTPPRASHFQPIELYWAAVKNDVASKYTSERNFQGVLGHMLEAFDKWGTPEFCAKLINHCDRKIRAFLAMIEQADDALENEQVDSDDDDEAASEPSEDDNDDESPQSISD